MKNEQNVIQKIKTSDHVVLYGKESKAKALLPCVEFLNSNLEVAVTRQDKEEFLENHRIKGIQDVTVDNNTAVLICTNEKYHDEIKAMKEVENAGFVKGMSMPEIMEIKRICVMEQLKTAGIDIRLWMDLNYQDLMDGTQHDMDAFMKKPRKPSIASEMWKISVRESAEYAIKAMRSAKQFSDVDEYHKYVGALLSKQSSTEIGVEFGVAGGNLLNFFAAQTARRFYGFDCFEGLPETWMDGVGKGSFKQVQLPKVRENVELVTGFFEESLPKFIEEYAQEIENIGFIHIDCDLYSSTKTIFEYLGKYIKSGTIIAFDEYFNYPGWQQDEFKAFQEWGAQNNISYEYLAFVENNTQVCIRIR